MADKRHKRTIMRAGFSNAYADGQMYAGILIKRDILSLTNVVKSDF